MPKTRKSNDIRAILGKAIKTRRQEMKMSTYKFATMWGKAQPRVVELEKGKIASIDTYFRCIRLLKGNIDVQWD